ncbi:hypothetical protein F4819DRAFT_509289 [Hypoxylon fuscum]|nr:hypothetical protein F4819DRAFT_509289 [Hypoxylon fuscum]
MRNFHIRFFGLMATGVFAGFKGTHDSVESPRHEIFNGYKVAPLTIRGSIASDGVEMTFQGTIQEIYKEILGIRPDFSWDQFQPSMRGRSKPLGKRYDYIDHVLCHVQGLPPASKSGINSNSQNLNNLATDLTSDSHSCTQVSCLEKTAIWFCNDNNWYIEKNSIELADQVNSILENSNCGTSGNDDLIQAQAFLTGDWNIIINGDDKC